MNSGENQLDKAMEEMGCFIVHRVILATTEQFMKMAEDSRNRNQGPKIEKLMEAIDPDGLHIMISQILHNDSEVRSWWFVKLRESLYPSIIMIDTDIAVFQKNHFIRDIDQVELDGLVEESP